MSAILKVRNANEKQLRPILRDGSAEGTFIVEDVKLTAMAIIQMITGVIVWFRPNERLSVEEVTATYHRMTLRLLGVGEARELADVRPRHELRAG